MPVATGVVGDLRLGARRAAQRVAAERDAAALFDGRHDLQLAEAQVAALTADAKSARGRGRYPRPPGRGAPRAATVSGRDPAPADRSPGAGSRSRRGYRAMSSRASCGRVAPGSRGYPPSVRAGGWRNCAAYISQDIGGTISRARLCRVCKPKPCNLRRTRRTHSI